MSSPSGVRNAETVSENVFKVSEARHNTEQDHLQGTDCNVDALRFIDVVSGLAILRPHVEER